MLRNLAILALLCGSVLYRPALAADTASIPDFSGTWGRRAFDHEQPSSGRVRVVPLGG